MTREEFDRAAARESPVRLKDRTRCNYVNEWYMPIKRPDGSRAIDTHTGEVHVVDAELLDKLRERIRGTTVGEIRNALANLEDDSPMVMSNGDGRFHDIETKSIGRVTIAVEAYAEEEGQEGTHGEDDRATGPYDPIEEVFAITPRRPTLRTGHSG